MMKLQDIFDMKVI